MRFLRWVAAALLLALTACSSSSQTPRPTPQPACLGAGATTFTVASAGGFEHKAALYGMGPAVLIAHQSDQDICDAVPVARWLQSKGYTGVALELQGGRWDVSLADAVATLRKRGASSIQLLGASKGGSAAIVAAASLDPPPASVVSLSGERSLSGLDADAAVASSAVPLLVVAGDGDPYLNGADAAALLAESRATDKKLLVEPGSDHGFELLNGGQANAVRPAILAWLAAHR